MSYCECLKSKCHRLNYKCTNEMQMQSKLVAKFSDEFPRFTDLFWHVNNDMKLTRSHGQVPGVADMHLYVGGILVCVELKYPTTKHSPIHLARQKEWGEKIKEQRGEYLMTDSVSEAFDFVAKFASLFY